MRQDELGVNLTAGGDTKLSPHCNRHRMTGSCFRGTFLLLPGASGSGNVPFRNDA